MTGPAGELIEEEDEFIHGGGGVVGQMRAGAAATVPEFLRAPEGFGLTGQQEVKDGGSLAVFRQEAAQAGEGLEAIEGAIDVLEVKDEPEFEAGVGIGEIEVALVRPVEGLLDFGVFIAVEDAPDVVEAPAAAFHPFFSLAGVADDASGIGAGDAAGDDVDPGRREASVATQGVEVEGLGLVALADDEDHGLGIPGGRGAAERGGVAGDFLEAEAVVHSGRSPMKGMAP